DGIRDFHVNGVQTCALPISVTSNAWWQLVGPAGAVDGRIAVFDGTSGKQLKQASVAISDLQTAKSPPQGRLSLVAATAAPESDRSEERRVGKEGGARWSEDQ